MEQRRRDWASILSQGPSKDPPFDVSAKARSGAWGIPHGVTAYDGSNDTSLFSSSLPILPHEKLNFVESLQSIRSIDGGVAKGIGGEPLEDIESTAVGIFLPDEDELLTGMMDDLDLARLPSQMDELEEYDIFGNGGGMELEVDPQESLRFGIPQLSISDGIAANGISPYAFANGAATMAGEHPYGEHPSRTLFVRNINSNVEDSELKSLFEQYGDIRTLYTACKHRGFVMISYYDIRDARTAMHALQNKPLRRRKLDIHFSIPKDNPLEKDVNQGTLVVFNLDASVSNEDLRLIFGGYGEVKEIRETPHKKHHKFIEFYDVRAADAALRALNRSDIAGKRIKVEPSRPGGARKNLMQQLYQELEQEEAISFRHQVGSPITNSPPGPRAQFYLGKPVPHTTTLTGRESGTKSRQTLNTRYDLKIIGSPAEQNPFHTFSKSPVLGPLSPVTTSHLSGLASILPPPHISGSPKISPIGKDPGRYNIPSPTTGFTYPSSNSLSELNLGASPRSISSLGGSSSLSSGIATLSGPQFLWGSPPPYSEQATSSAWPTRPLTSAQGRHGFPYATRQGSLLSSQQPHNVGSAPSGVPLDRHFGFFPESPESSFMSSAAVGGSGLNRSMGNYMMGMGSQMSPSIGLNGNMENGSPNFRMMQMPRHGPMMLGNGYFPSGFDALGRTRRVEASGAQIDSKKQYQLDLEKIMNRDDTRTTLMIKNIPNKYTSKMLLAAIDENHRATYDFLYLPIDFKTFNGKKWEMFNSEKVASLAYARIQGKAALVTHFQNSSLMNEDKRCRPIVFHSEGQELTEQEYLVSGSLNICIRQVDGSYSGDSPTDTFDEYAKY